MAQLIGQLSGVRDLLLNRYDLDRANELLGKFKDIQTEYLRMLHTAAGHPSYLDWTNSTYRIGEWNALASQVNKALNEFKKEPVRRDALASMLAIGVMHVGLICFARARRPAYDVRVMGQEFLSYFQQAGDPNVANSVATSLGVNQAEMASLRKALLAEHIDLPPEGQSHNRQLSRMLVRGRNRKEQGYNFFVTLVSEPVAVPPIPGEKEPLRFISYRIEGDVQQGPADASMTKLVITKAATDAEYRAEAWKFVEGAPLAKTALGRIRPMLGKLNIHGALTVLDAVALVRLDGATDYLFDYFKVAR